MCKKNFSPKSFLKNRRSERYSDSVVIENSNLTRSQLEHHLSTVNKRSQELAFETYVKRICEKVICPNLLEQTGPVAGGDGKVDTQTFPVSEQTRNIWYEGVNESSHSERWGFAVSSQETWKAKCQADIRKIVNTNRGYTKAFFITNQYAKSDQRSELEDNLSKETSIEVRILDISFLLDQTFKHDLLDIAIETLSITGAKSKSIRQGPNDYSRQIDFENIDNKIRNEIDPSSITVGQVDLFLELAILNKESEKNIIESQGLFDRAIRISKQFGTNQQIFNAYYEYAWASLWWFEDFELFKTNLINAYQYTKESENATRWYDFITLLNTHYGYCKNSQLTESEAIKDIFSSTINCLENISLDESRPSNSLLAKTSHALLRLVRSKSEDEAKIIFVEIFDIVKTSSKLIGYPFESLFELISELESAFGEIDEYITLLDFLTDHAGFRSSEIQTSLKNLKRGARKLENDKPNQAIKLIGKSLTGLYKNESQRDIYAGLILISHAYSDIGLNWASRGSLLLAASLATDKFWSNEELSPAQVKVYMKLAWVELKLGRICHALSWLNVVLIIDNNLEKSVIKESEYLNMDAFIAHILLNQNIKTYKILEKLPDALDSLGLFNSRAMLLHCFGYEQQVSEEYEIDINQDHIDFLIQARDYDFKTPTPKFEDFSGKWREISTSVLGCDITISFPKRTPFVELAESIIAAIEGFCSTGLTDSVVSRESVLKIDIIADDDGDIRISHEFDASNPELQAEITCTSFPQNLLSIHGQGIIQNWMHKFIIETYCYIAAPKDGETNFESLLLNENALERSVSFTTSFITQHNILGDNAINDISSILNNDDFKQYKSIRTEQWDNNYPRTEKEEIRKLDMETLSHKDMMSQNIIIPRLWDQASWEGTAFFEQDNMPVMALLFKDNEVGKLIFSNLHSKFGNLNKEQRLGVSIITNISEEYPHSYKVMVYENINYDTRKLTAVISRINTMNPTNNINLNNFLNNYKNKGVFALSYGTRHNDGAIIPDDIKQHMVIIKEISIKKLNELEKNDIENVAFIKK